MSVKTLIVILKALRLLIDAAIPLLEKVPVADQTQLPA